MSTNSDLVIPAVRLFLNLTLFGSPIAVGIALSFRLTRVASPRVRYLIALAGFFVVALLPVVTTLHKDRDGAVISGSAFSAIFDRADQTDASAPVSKLSPPAQNVNTGLLPVRVTLSDRVNALVERVGESPFGFWLLTVWIAAAALLLGREIIGHLLVGRIRRTWQAAPAALRHELGWPEGFSLFIHDQEWPCTVGFFKPLVVLPAGLSSSLPPEATKRIARHELSHARWRDPLINAVVRIVRALLWPSLPLWFLERVVRAEREVSADRAAIASTASSQEMTRIVADYATALVAVAQWCTHRKVPRLYNSAATHIGAVHLEERVHRLLNFSAPLTRTRLTCAGVLLLTGFVATAFLPVTSQGLDAQSRAEQRRLNIERRMAIRSTNSSAAQQSTPAMNALIMALKKHDWQLDGEVKLALQEIKWSGTIEPLIITLEEDKDWRVREKMAWALGQLKDRSAVEPLIVALGDDAGEVKRTAAWALGMIGDSRAVDPLIANLRDGNSESRHGAAWGLGSIGDRRAVTPLIALLKDRDSDVRHGAAWALGGIGDQRAVVPLKAVLEDRDADVRAEAARALTKLGH